MEQQTLEMFKTLTELPGAPGNEHAVRAYMRTYLEQYSDEIVQDNLGGIFGVKYGAEGTPKILVAGHMDEVAFMVTQITDNGMIRFQTLGGWSNQVMLAQRVQIYTDKNGPIPGVIASVPPHLLSPEQRNKPMEIKNMLIDIGADDREDAISMGVVPGQSIIPDSKFQVMANPKKVMAKAWDNRYGCGLSLELMKEVHGETLPNTLYAGANVMEEVGLRGAKVSANMIKPDLFFALDASPANDATGDKTQFGQLGNGPLLRIFDRTMVTHKGMREFILDTAETNNIPYQYFVSPGGTDAGNVHVANDGVPSSVIGICSRYIHSHASIVNLDDIDAAKALIVALVRAADTSTLNTILGK